ncbi:phosphotransferase [Beduini massiliensis]|uniref:phosphotransferase n=1 Tax=Beduini massiliensis TaxID=1585974 RepID=UPI00094410B4|nr:phosphotransferase [Beduini massiliensis]
MKEPTLIILAAGLGSRYGGLKQLDAFLPQDKTIIEYSLYDAYKAGFRKFVIVIKKENEEAVKQMVHHSFDESFDIMYVYQTPWAGRLKPLGTAHALYCCKDAVSGAMGIINGDDYYGYESFVKLYYFLKTKVDAQNYAMVGYRLENTLSHFGGVSRGICYEEDGYLKTVQECTGIFDDEGQIKCDLPITLKSNQIVSMNMWGFDDHIFSQIEHYLHLFLENEYKDNPEKAEFYLPAVFDRLIKEEKVRVHILKSDAKWYGVTYKEDRQEVIDGITGQLDHYQTNLSEYDRVLHKIKKIAEQFDISGEIVQILLNQSGNINDTYQVKTTKDHYLLQRINHHIFKNVEGLMNNMALVTQHLLGMGRVTLELVRTKENQLYLVNEGNYYRIFKFILNSFTYDYSENIEDFYRTAKCFGTFFKDLRDFDASTLIETIPDFHNTPVRYQQFEKCLKSGDPERITEAKEEIEALIERKKISQRLYDLYDAGEILQRVCHNDTKLSNILMDKTTREPICVIDFDTIMPGFIGYDFGDALRSGANHTYEDNPNLDEVYFDLELFEAFSKGFLESLKDTLTAGEINALVDGVKVIVYEQTLRFLSDYLDGDRYYKTSFPKHNLIRAKNQLALLVDIEKKESLMREIIERYK